ASLKFNYGPRPPTLALAFEDVRGHARVRWCGESELTADDVFQGEGDAVERPARELAKVVIRDLLTIGEQHSKVVLQKGREAGVSEGTMLRAKRELGVTHHPVGGNQDRHILSRKPTA